MTVTEKALNNLVAPAKRGSLSQGSESESHMDEGGEGGRERHEEASSDVASCLWKAPSAKEQWAALRS